jgi:hypothetical protein
MAVSGGMDYFQPRFDGVDWQNIESPWLHSVQAQRDNSIQAQVRSFQLYETSSWEHEVIFDDIERSKKDQTKAVVLGIEKMKDVMEARHYVLLMDMMAEFTSVGYELRECCKRVGAGHLPGKWLTGAATLCALI